MLNRGCAWVALSAVLFRTLQSPLSSFATTSARGLLISGSCSSFRLRWRPIPGLEPARVDLELPGKNVISNVSNKLRHRPKALPAIRTAGDHDTVATLGYGRRIVYEMTEVVTLDF
jgi:hypothetical protein